MNDTYKIFKFMLVQHEQVLGDRFEHGSDIIASVSTRLDVVMEAKFFH